MSLISSTSSTSRADSPMTSAPENFLFPGRVSRGTTHGRNLCSPYAADDKEQAVKLFKQYDRTALPVINNDGFLLGIVTIDDVLDVVEEMNTQDIQKFGGVEALDYPYIKTPLLAMAKKRPGGL